MIALAFVALGVVALALGVVVALVANNTSLTKSNGTLHDDLDKERKTREGVERERDDHGKEIDAKNAQLKDMFAQLGAAKAELANAHQEAMKYAIDIAKDANATTVEQLLNALMQAPPVARVAAGAEDGARPLAIVRPGPETSSAR